MEDRTKLYRATDDEERWVVQSWLSSEAGGGTGGEQVVDGEGEGRAVAAAGKEKGEIGSERDWQRAGGWKKGER